MKIFFLAVLTASLCFVSSTFSQEKSNTQSTFPEEAVVTPTPYETTITLLQTPVRDQSIFPSPITLKKNQDLIVNVIPPDETWLNGDISDSEEGALDFKYLMAFISRASFPNFTELEDDLKPLKLELSLCTNGFPLRYYFKYQYKGKLTITFRPTNKNELYFTFLTVTTK